MTGKNFSCNNVSGKRRKSDFYETPYSLTRLLLGLVKLNGTVLEPACGDGAIVKVLREFGYSPTHYDKERDFLTETRGFDTVITNPPYSLAFEFIQRAKEISDDIYLLLPLAYLHGKQRYDHLYTDKRFPLRKIWVFTRYPMLGERLREDGRCKTGMMVYAWYWFSRGYKGEPRVAWLDNNAFVMGSK